MKKSNIKAHLSVLLEEDAEGKELKAKIVKHLYALIYHLRSYF